MSLVPQLLLNALITGSIYALAAAGLALTYGAFRILNFSHGAMVMLGAYLFYALNIGLGLSVPQSFLALIFIAYPLSKIISIIFITPFATQHPLLPFVSTLALAIILENLVALLFGVNVLSISSELSSPLELFADLSITSQQTCIVLSTIGSLYLLGWYLRSTQFGLQVRALCENQLFSRAAGVPVSQRQSALFFIATALSFMAGTALAFETNLQPQMGAQIMIKAFAAMILGGLGQVSGAVIGAFLIATIESLGVGLDLGPFSIPASYRDSFSLVFILLVLLYKPEGLFRMKARRS